MCVLYRGVLYRDNMCVLYRDNMCVLYREIRVMKGIGGNVRENRAMKGIGPV